MDCDEEENSGVPPDPRDVESRSAVNSLILDYYKKFGRKRDLEQYFSLSTAQSDIRDPSSAFWSKIKAENESSDSGEKSDVKIKSPQELCRISIRFPAQDPCTSQEEDSKTKTESVSPPIIIEELPQDSVQNSEDEALKSDDNNSQKSYDVMLDTSINKPHSPSSSITSQRKLEWDSLADVGYANESDRKTSASSLSTLERLALKQQYSNNDTQLGSNVGNPTAHSTPLDESETKSKIKKGMGKKSTQIYKKDVDFVEVNVPHLSNMNPSQSINVNLTKHISFNVEKDGKVVIDNVHKDVTVSPEKVSVETEVSPRLRMDKEMQTSLTQFPNASSNLTENVQPQTQPQKIPILISLNSLRTRVRRKKLRKARRKLKSKRRPDKEAIVIQEKSGEQLSEAESFEYMPGHIYNQNQMTANDRPSNVADNKSSLESSGVMTDSSKASKHSFAKDLEKSIDLLKAALQQHCDDSTLRKRLIKQVCQRLLKSRYRDDDSTTDFLSGLSFSSKKLGLGETNNTTTSTSDGNNSTETSKRPKKSILRTDKFNPGSIASTSQSVPNLPVASNSENLVTSNLAKNLTLSNTDSDVSSKEKTSSDNVVAKTSSEELYKKYLQALKREEAYKKHLKDKEIFLKQKLVSSDSVFKVPARVNVKPSSRLSDLINDLTRNNYDDGSGDASKLEGGPGSNTDLNRFFPIRSQRSHSVFTISSGNSGDPNKKPNFKKILQSDIKDLSKPGPSKNSHFCCCPYHSGNIKFMDSSVQVNIKNPCSVDSCPARQRKAEQQKEELPQNLAKVISDDVKSNVKYVCLCSRKDFQEVPDDFLIYKCSRLNNKGIQSGDTSTKTANESYAKCNNQTCDKRNIQKVPSASIGLTSKSSQTDMLIKMLQEQSISDDKIKVDDVLIPLKSPCSIYEATRWIQTEISINPKISEPTLSDINIVSDSDCAKLITEQHRELSKPSLTSVFSCQVEGTAVSTNNGSYKSSGTSKDAGSELKDDYHYNGTVKNKTGNIESQKTTIDQTENFRIPILGTNMTLMVRIGSECRACTNKHTKEMITQCIGTDKVNAIEQATCLTEECSKGVQFDKTNDFSTIDHNSNKIGDEFQMRNAITETITKSRMVNADYQTRKEPKFGTYPKTSLVNELNLFRRSNTDTDTIQTGISKGFGNNMNMQDEKCSFGCKGNKENCTKNCKERKFSPRDNNQLCHQKNIPDDQIEKCLCACGGPIVDCKDDCVELKSSQYRKLPLEKGVSTQTDHPIVGQNDILDNRNEQCSFGFGGLKYGGREDCFVLESSPNEPYQKQTLDKQLPIQEDLISNNQSQKCFCGCNGTKDKCRKSCKVLKLSPKRQCEIQTFEHTSTQLDISIKQSEKCLCGCGGMKDKCKKSCKEYKSSPRKQCGKPLTYKQIDIQTDNLSNQNEKCSCGCGGAKEKCKKTCKELKSSPRKQCEKTSTDTQIDTQTDILLFNQNEKIKCSCGCGGTIDKCKRRCKNLKSPSREQCGKQSTDKQIDTQTDMLFNQYDLCPCGCGGTNDKCKNSCKELKSLSTTQYKTQSNEKQNETQTDIPFNQNEICLCGCGGMKENCKADCIELKLTLRDQCRKQAVDETVYTALGFTSMQREKKSCKSPSLDRNQKEIETQRDHEESPNSSGICRTNVEPKYIPRSTAARRTKEPLKRTDSEEQTDITSSDNQKKSTSETEQTDVIPDRILNMIQDITKKFTKKETEKSKRKKCFKEIITVLNYLLETDESTDQKEDQKNMCDSTSTDPSIKKVPEKSSSEKVPTKLVDKEVQLSCKEPHPRVTETSDLPTSTDIPGTSSSSSTCKVLNKIKKECERFHQKRCKIHNGKKCDGTSSTSMNCDQCRRVHHCSCRGHKCKGYKKSNEKIMKNPIAYNLILQTSESILSDEQGHCCNKNRTLQNIIVKVPKKKPMESMPFRELAAKFEKHMLMSETTKDPRSSRSKSLPNETEISSMEEIIRKSQGATVREYLEKNRPDFIEKCSQRQNCLRYISESRANERAFKRDLLSMRVAQLPDVTELDSDELRRLAKDVGWHMRQKQPAPKFISERDMKKHSEKIYKSLPEVIQKKEEKKKENIKKTNLLMANMFKKNLQKKTLRGSVNLSNYSTVIKI